MEKWVENGCKLAWLIDPIQQKSYVYKSHTAVEEITGFDKTLQAEPLLPGFELNLNRLL
jgi:Uma2 family endonuclease